MEIENGSDMYLDNIVKREIGARDYKVGVGDNKKSTSESQCKTSAENDFFPFMKLSSELRMAVYQRCTEEIIHNLRGVSQDLSFEVDSFRGHSVTVGFNNASALPNYPVKKMTILSDELTISVPLNPHLLREIIVVGDVSQNTLDLIFRSCLNIETFSWIHKGNQYCFGKDQKDVIDNMLYIKLDDLTNLRKLVLDVNFTELPCFDRISPVQFVTSRNPERKVMSTIVSNITNMLQIPRIRRLSSFVFVINFMTGPLMLRIFQFLLCHSQTINSLTLCIRWADTLDNGLNNEQLQKITLNGIGLQLKCLNLLLILNNQMKIRVWEQFICKQKMLESLGIQTNIFLWSNIVPVIKNSFKTLRRVVVLDLCGREQEIVHVDLAVFESCESLKHLSIGGINRECADDYNPLDVSNLSFLPSCIKELSFRHLRISTFEFYNLHITLPMLQHLYIRNVGRGHAGLNATGFKSIIEHLGSLLLATLDELNLTAWGEYAVLQDIIHGYEICTVSNRNCSFYVYDNFGRIGEYFFGEGYGAVQFHDKLFSNSLS